MSKHNPLTGVPPTTTALRSDQLDAPLIDDELHSHLMPRIKKLFHYINLQQQHSSSFSILDDDSFFGNYKEQIITYLVKTLSFLVTIAHGYPSPAMAALGLKLTTIPKGGTASNIPRSNSDGQYPSRHRLFILFLGSIVLPCLQPILEDYIRINNNNDDDDNDDNISNHQRTTIIANQRRRLILQFILKIIPLLRLVNYVTFLINPSSQPPTLSLRAAGITYDTNISPLTNRSLPKRINYAYAQRRVLYAELFRCGKALLPSMGTWEELSRWRLWLSSIWSRRRRRRRDGVGVVVRNDGDGTTTNDNDDDFCCPICQNVPSIPYVSSSCHHVFCYVCLRYAIIDDPSYKCHLCGVTIGKSLPLKYDGGLE